MSKLKLGPIEDDTPVKLTLDLPAALHRELLEYAKAMAAEHGGKTVEPAKLIPPMLAHFMGSDRGFNRNRRPRGG
ncbi:DUF2274 domain-containing protein [Caulobacter flavus]|uniref:DUF2274 domain-containing protein n=1 Tax=Caulobacter flavus TaxID=1679497 RepID=A0A2N5CP87_9CAUL|nr:DUF2274 domain-containing protein [Caulobacter flavus]AYV48516.1 DUF2274 domain-containing protein [Caulobacter flavus]PLR08769.1 DUF2274 domain-containing protein [Caulobacter flavus]